MSPIYQHHQISIFSSYTQFYSPVADVQTRNRSSFYCCLGRNLAELAGAAGEGPKVEQSGQLAEESGNRAVKDLDVAGDRG